MPQYTIVSRTSTTCAPPFDGSSIAVTRCFQDSKLPEFITVCALAAAWQKSRYVLIISVGGGNLHTENVLAATTKMFNRNCDVVLINVDPIGGHFQSTQDEEFLSILAQLRVNATVVLSLIWPDSTSLIETNKFDIEAVKDVNPDFIISMTEIVYSIAGTQEFFTHLTGMRELHTTRKEHDFVKSMLDRFVYFKKNIADIIASVKKCGSFVDAIAATGAEGYKQRMTIKTLEHLMSEADIDVAKFVKPENRSRVIKVLDDAIARYKNYKKGIIQCQVHCRPGIPVFRLPLV